MILDPVNSITSVTFYRRIAGQGLGRTFLYLTYLGLFFSVAFLIMLKTRVWPPVQQTLTWLETSVPAITYSAGRLSTPANARLVVRHPQLPAVAFVVDTSRSSPVTGQEMADEKVGAFVSSNALYILHPGGRVEAFDFSKAPPGKTTVIDAKFYQALSRSLVLVIYPLGFLVCLAAFLVWKAIAALFYSLIALIANGVAEAGLPYRTLFNISAYAQTLVVAVQCLLLLLPAHIPLLRLLGLVATTAYIWLAIKKTAAPVPQPS